MKVIIVEDEKIIRNGMVRHVAWESLGVNEVRAAANTQEALEICGNYVPDIIVSDISMPEENGIVLCRKLRKLYPETEIIFVTGYADKEYLKAAIDLHAVRYVEKPVSRKDIAEAVEEAVSRCRRTREQKAAQLHMLFMDPSSFPMDFCGRHVFQVGILHLGQREGVAAVKQRFTEGLDEWLRDSGVGMLTEITDPATVSFLLTGDDAIPLGTKDRGAYVQTVRQILGDEIGWFLAMGSQVEETEQIPDSWKAALHVLKALAYMGWRQTAFPEELQGKGRFELDGGVLVEQFANAISCKKEEAAANLLDEFAQKLNSGQAFLCGDIRHVYYSLNRIITQARSGLRLNGQAGAAGDADDDFMEQAETFAEMNAYLRSRLSGVFENGEAQRNAYAVKRVMDYIRENYGDSSLSVRTLAEHVYLTPPYLSNLFKKNTGLTIGQYLADVRIENAKRLMKEPKLKFYQVASMVGYEDSNYFAKIFKKKTNMTPSEYKESLSVR